MGWQCCLHGETPDSSPARRPYRLRYQPYDAAAKGPALSAFSRSHDEFDRWFKQRLADATGLDLNTLPTAPLPELLSSYPANGRH